MLTLRKILFPVDFSDQCVQAAPYVAGLARKFESELILLHAFGIYDDFAYGTASPTVVYAAYEDLIRQRRAAELESFACKEFEGLKVTRTLEVGEAGDAIAQYAHGHGIDLIVMPTHGRGRFRRLLLGSVTSKVLHDTTCPVWTTMHSELLVTGGSQDIHSILCAVDLGSETTHVIRAASDMAVRCGAVVRLVHAITSPGLGRGVAEEAPFQRFLLKGATEHLGTLQHEAQTNFGVCIKQGSVATVIREAALNCGAQLVVIGRGRMQEFLGRLRTSAGAIICESPCPVLSV